MDQEPRNLHIVPKCKTELVEKDISHLLYVLWLIYFQSSIVSHNQVRMVRGWPKPKKKNQHLLIFLQKDSGQNTAAVGLDLNS